MLDRLLIWTHIRHNPLVWLLNSIVYYWSNWFRWHYWASIGRIRTISSYIIINKDVLISQLSSGVNCLWKLWCLRSPCASLLVSYRRLSWNLTLFLGYISQGILPLMWRYLFLILFLYNFFKHISVRLLLSVSAHWGSEALLKLNRFWWKHSWPIRSFSSALCMWCSNSSDGVATCIISKSSKLVLIHFNWSVELKCGLRLDCHLKFSEW